MKNDNLLFVLDDDEFYCQLLSAHLSKYNLQVSTYSNSKECVDDLNKNPFLILLDYNLNGNDKFLKSGKEVFKHIKTFFPQIEIIIISNQDSGPVVMDLIRSGVRNYVEKDENTFKNLDTIIESIMNFSDTGEE